jgi:N-acetylmuramoyl-L-alanine amidase
MRLRARHSARTMTIARGVLLLMAVLAMGPSGRAIHGSTPTRLPRTSFLGREYVRLDDWARAHGFRLQWTVRQEEVRLSSAFSTLIFNIDSRRAVVNGIAIWLSTPIALRNNAACIAPADLNTSIHPILFPSKNSAGDTISTICLDPGHGGKDPGNREGRQQEKRYTLLLAQDVKAALIKAGFRVTFTRERDVFIDLPRRADIARQRKADLLVSLHFNSADSSAARSVQGVEVYCMTPARASSTNTRGEGGASGSFPGNRLDSQNVLLAYQIQKAMVRGLDAEDRGVRRARFQVLREAQMPAVLVEAGFMTHPVESKKIYSSAYRQQMAQAITSGIVAYKKAVEQSVR